jgi:hypothetical protein
MSQCQWDNDDSCTNPEANELGITKCIGYAPCNFYLGKFCRIAWNQCQAINPNNPQAVADGLVDMYEALKNTRDLFKDEVDVFDDWFEEVERALAKVEAK